MLKENKVKKKNVQRSESKKEDEIEFEVEDKIETAHKIKEMENKLKESEKSKKTVMDEYLKCERELRMRTEEMEKL